MEAWTSSIKEPTREEEEAWGRRSSIGNVKTLRSKLQARRVTLNEAIEKENMFLQGSQRLASLTTDRHSKVEATLQKDFAHSKIKTLQAELTKINSSLHAYQAGSAQGVQVPLIPLAMKITVTIDFTPAFSSVMLSHYHTEAEEYVDVMEKFNELRREVPEVERSEVGIRQLMEYYSQLMFVAKRLLHSKLNHGVNFVWYDAISGIPATQQSTVFERASIMFNVGALYSQLAAKVDRKSADNLDLAKQYLEQAIGVFEYMKEKFSHSPMVDMTSEILSLFSDLMRAQAQELTWEKDTLSRSEDENISDLDLPVLMDRSHKAKSVAECYRPVRELVDDDTIKKYLPDVWVAFVKIKDAHYKAVAHYYAAMTHHKLALIFADGKQVLEEIRTEVRFLYQDCPPEATTNHPKLHIGLMKSHINCAILSHEYALKFCNLCRDLHHMGCLTKMLAEGQALTVSLQEDTADMEGVTMIAPTIIPCEMELSARPPSFKEYEVDDLFFRLGPLPVFSGDRQWGAPRCILLSRVKGSFGVSVRGSQPVKVTCVDPKGSAEKAGVLIHDWVLAINGEDVKYKSHDEVVAMVKSCKEEVTLLLSTPSDAEASEGNGTMTSRKKGSCHSLGPVETHELDIT